MKRKQAQVSSHQIHALLVGGRPISNLGEAEQAIWGRHHRSGSHSPLASPLKAFPSRILEQYAAAQTQEQVSSPVLSHLGDTRAGLFRAAEALGVEEVGMAPEPGYDPTARTLQVAAPGVLALAMMVRYLPEMLDSGGPVASAFLQGKKPAEDIGADVLGDGLLVLHLITHGVGAVLHDLRVGSDARDWLRGSGGYRHLTDGSALGQVFARQMQLLDILYRENEEPEKA